MFDCYLKLMCVCLCVCLSGEARCVRRENERVLRRHARGRRTCPRRMRRLVCRQRFPAHQRGRPRHAVHTSALPLLGNFPKILGIWGSTWDLGNFPSNLGNSGISRKFREILVIQYPNLQRLTSVVFIHYFTASHSLTEYCHVSAITAFTYLSLF